MRTAQLLVTGEHPDCRGRGVEMEEDDVRQLLRLKVHYMLKRFDPAKLNPKKAAYHANGGRQRYGSTKTIDKARDGYVNMGLRDQVKDIAKKKRRGELLIEDIASVQLGDGERGRDKFDERYLSAGHDETFAEVEDQMPTLPSTLSEREREVVTLMFQDYRQIEIAGVLNITKREVESAVRGVRTKMADWRPSRPSREVTPVSA